MEHYIIPPTCANFLRLNTPKNIGGSKPKSKRHASKAKGGVKQMTMAESIEKAQPHSEPFTLVDNIGFTRLMK